MNLVRRNRSQVDFQLRTMTYLLRFRRFALLLLSLSLTTQAMAAASFASCHRVQALLSATQLTASAPDQHRSRSISAAVTHHQHGSFAHHGDTAHDLESSHGSKSEKSRVKCAACAACLLCSVVLPTENGLADVPKAASTSFLEFTVPRVRNVASGLERPPRA